MASSLNQQLLGEMNGILLQAMQTLNEKLMQGGPSVPVPATPAPVVAAAAALEVVGKKRRISKKQTEGGDEKTKKKKTGPKSDSAWICFVKARSPQVKLQPGEKLMKVLGAEWALLSEADKAPYESAAADKVADLIATSAVVSDLIAASAAEVV
jgi:hypothetical protein